MIDESKWDEVDSYRGGSVLKEEFMPSQELKKIRILFRWHLNAFLGNSASDTFRRLIDEFDRLPDEYWENGVIEQKYKEKDTEIDLSLRNQDISHYISKKYINMFWGKEYDYDIS